MLGRVASSKPSAPIHASPDEHFKETPWRYAQKVGEIEVGIVSWAINLIPCFVHLLENPKYCLTWLD